MLVLQLNRMTLLWALPGAFLAVTYPFVKRFLSVPQLYLGVAFGWGIPMAFEAQVEYIPRVAWLFVIANMLWVTVYDTLYAMVDRDDDLKIGVRSTAILFGDSDRHIIAVLQAHDAPVAVPRGPHAAHDRLVLRRAHRRRDASSSISCG